MPEVVGDVTNAKASFESPYGLIKTEWTKKSSSFDLQVQIPANSTAVVVIPAKQDEVIILNNKRINPPFENGKAEVKIGSGSYHFVVRVLN
jgi:alpha-L-rhamnosidase